MTRLMHHARLAAIAALALIVVWGAPLRAWGPVGHHIVARIALARLTPEAAQATRALLGADDFVAISTWADQIRQDRPETYNWHFVDIPYGAPTYEPARDCPPTDRGDCVLAELARARRDLANTALTAVQRKEALQFLIHFMGDLHQPLHDIDHQDRGGNDVMVNIAGYTPSRGQPNLHAAWDSVLIGQRGIEEEAYATMLLRGLIAQPAPVEPIDFVKWALEGHALGEQIVYTYAGFSRGSPPAGVMSLDAGYQTRAAPVIDRQLTLAGVRLARVINEALAGGR